MIANLINWTPLSTQGTSLNRYRNEAYTSPLSLKAKETESLSGMLLSCLERSIEPIHIIYHSDEGNHDESSTLTFAFESEKDDSHTNMFLSFCIYKSPFTDLGLVIYNSFEHIWDNGAKWSRQSGWTILDKRMAPFEDTIDFQKDAMDRFTQKYGHLQNILTQNKDVVEFMKPKLLGFPGFKKVLQELHSKEFVESLINQ